MTIQPGDFKKYLQLFKVKSGGGSGGTGDVVGPASSVDSDIAVFDGTTGKLIKDGGVKVNALAGKDTVNNFSNYNNFGNVVTNNTYFNDLPLPNGASPSALIQGFINLQPTDQGQELVLPAAVDIFDYLISLSNESTIPVNTQFYGTFNNISGFDALLVFGAGMNFDRVVSDAVQSGTCVAYTFVFTDVSDPSNPIISVGGGEILSEGNYITNPPEGAENDLLVRNSDATYSNFTIASPLGTIQIGFGPTGPFTGNLNLDVGDNVAKLDGNNTWGGTNYFANPTIFEVVQTGQITSIGYNAGFIYTSYLTSDTLLEPYMIQGKSIYIGENATDDFTIDWNNAENLINAILNSQNGSAIENFKIFNPSNITVTITNTTDPSRIDTSLLFGGDSVILAPQSVLIADISVYDRTNNIVGIIGKTYKNGDSIDLIPLNNHFSGTNTFLNPVASTRLTASMSGGTISAFSLTHGLVRFSDAAHSQWTLDTGVNIEGSLFSLPFDTSIDLIFDNQTDYQKQILASSGMTLDGMSFPGSFVIPSRSKITVSLFKATTNSYTLIGNSFSSTAISPIVSVSGTSKTLGPMDAGTTQICNSAVTVTITINATFMSAVPIGAIVDFAQMGVGSVSFVAGIGFFIQSSVGSNPKTSGINLSAKLKKISSTDVLITGSIMA